MITQSFLYNAIFFTYGLVLKQFYGVGDTSLPYYFIGWAVLLSYLGFYAYRKRVEDKRQPAADEFAAGPGAPAPIAGASEDP